MKWLDALNIYNSEHMLPDKNSFQYERYRRLVEEEMQDMFPGDYVIIFGNDIKLNRLVLRMVFSNRDAETEFMLRWG